jgi:hypothetical protein
MKKSDSPLDRSALLNYQLGLLPFSLMGSGIPLAYPRFPSFQELVAQEAVSPSASLEDPLRVLLADDPSAIYQHSLEKPDLYTDQQKLLLHNLVSNPRPPTEEERALLNQSVVAWMQAPPSTISTPNLVPSSPATVKPPSTSRAKPAAKEEEDEPMKDIPPEVLKAFDWLLVPREGVEPPLIGSKPTVLAVRRPGKT